MPFLPSIEHVSSRSLSILLAIDSNGDCHNTGRVQEGASVIPFLVVRRLTLQSSVTVSQLKKKVEENRSTIFGASANLVNDIVGAGIAGMPYAVGQCGFFAGCFLVALCAVMTDKSLRLLVETAKYSKTPTYETLSEAAYGRSGFLFIAINMFVFSYGSMVGYLMMVKETLPYCFGIVSENARRLFLFLISLTVMVPVSSQRDMADLSKTSRLNVLFCTTIVGVVVYLSPLNDSLEESGGFVEFTTSSIVNVSTIFAGLGVFSYTYLVQHSAFIIAGSLYNPTRKRWASVTFRSMCVCCALCMTCGAVGYLTFQGQTRGNILDNFNPNNIYANIARALLGMTMLFIYPIEAFVSRHVCMVLFFTGQDAHDGDDTAVLDRADRRIFLTIAIYILAVIPAIIFINLGPVLSLTGTIGGSCLSYVGPGAVYLGIHGCRFIEMANEFFQISGNGAIRTGEKSSLLDVENSNGDANSRQKDNFCIRVIKGILWYASLMPIWYKIALVGSTGYEKFKQEEALKEQRMTRIDSSRDIESLATANSSMSSISEDGISRKSPYGTLRLSRAGGMSLVSPKIAARPLKPIPSIEGLRRQAASTPVEQEEKEDPRDSQENPTVMDYLVAVGFIIFGIIAFFAGLLSLYMELA